MSNPDNNLLTFLKKNSLFTNSPTKPGTRKSKSKSRSKDKHTPSKPQEPYFVDYQARSYAPQEQIDYKARSYAPQEQQIDYKARSYPPQEQQIDYKPRSYPPQEQDYKSRSFAPQEQDYKSRSFAPPQEQLAPLESNSNPRFVPLQTNNLRQGPALQDSRFNSLDDFEERPRGAEVRPSGGLSMPAGGQNDIWTGLVSHSSSF